MKTRKLLIATAAIIAFWNTTAIAQAPTEAAPKPPMRSKSKVVSIFSDAYTDITGTNFSPYWNQTTLVTNVKIAGNATLKFTKFNYQGFELGADINALPMTHLHIDVWTSNETSMAIAPVSHSTNNQNVALSPLKLNSWNSFDISLADVKAKWLSISDIFQFFFQGAGANTVYIDNLYFYNNMEGEDTEAPKEFTATQGLVTFNSIELLLNGTDNSGAVAYEITSGDSTETFSIASGSQKSFTFNKLEANKEYSFSVTAKDNSDNVAANSPISLTIKTLETPAGAPTPPARASHKVISIFSDSYTNIKGNTNFYPYWKQLTQVSMVDFQGNQTLKYDNLNYQGIELGSDINALPMTHLHVDVWTPNETSLKIAPVSHTATNTGMELKPLVLNTWNSFDIPLIDAKGKWLSIADVFQFMIEGAGGHVVYIDNLYFYNNSAIEDTEAPTTFTATKGIITFSSFELNLKASDNSGAVTYAISYGTKTDTVYGISGKSLLYTINALKGATAYDFTIAVKDPTGNTASNNPIIVSATTLEALPAPTPTAAESDVISIFSDTYTNVAGTNFNPFWSQTTVMSTIKIGNNSALSYANLNHQGTEFGSHVNASAMTHLHIDVWTANETSLQVTAISPGKEKLVALTPLKKNSWNSYDIPLTSFTGVVLSDVFQFKFVGSGGKTVFLDNLYFYKKSGTSVANIDTKCAVNIYPNPICDELTVESNSKINEVLVSNIYGQTIKLVSVNAIKSTIDMNNAPSGNYFISIKHSNGNVSNKKVIKL